MQRFTRERPRRRMMDTIAQPVAPDGFDPVTGLATPEMFRKRAEVEWQRRARAHGPMTVLRIDVDRFDIYRTQQGIEAANLRLRQVAEVIARNCRRRGDFAGRVGENEFAVLLSEAAPKGAEKVARQIVEEVAQLGQGNGGALPAVSIGIASAIPRPNRFLASLLQLAEQGVEQAAHSGGNQVISQREESR